MRSRATNLRTKIVALLLSLALLWAFAAWVTLREGVGLLWVQTHNSTIYQPSEPMLLDLQTERRLSAAYLGSPGEPQRKALDTGRRSAQQHATDFRRAVDSWQTDLATDDELRSRIDEVLTGLDGLDQTRTAIDARTIGRGAAAAAFTTVVDAIFRVYDSLAGLDDEQIAADAAALIQLNRMWELISREDALLTGAIAAGAVTAVERAQFTQIVGGQRFVGTETAAKLATADRTRYDALSVGAEFTRLRSLEDRVIHDVRAGGKVPASADEWRAAVDPALAALHDVILTGGDDIVDRAAPVALWVILRLLLAAGLGLLAVIASIVVSISTTRALLAQLEHLRQAARHLADERLPDVVARLGRGERLKVATEVPPLKFDEPVIDAVGQAFNAVQETAIRTAVEQADLRRSVRDIFLNIARRTQALVHRQLTLLDQLEKREDDPKNLEDLFRIDHLATRMRRNAENLLVLTGGRPGRAWRRNIPVIDVLRAAVAEVEDYTRVTVQPVEPVELAGRVVGDIVHLLAELIDNALAFSPPHTSVDVKGQRVANGYVVEVEDRGLGMSAEDIAAANQRITSADEYSLTDNAAQLGLWVVNRLAARHGVRVQLKESAYGGTLAIALIPAHLVIDRDNGSPGDEPVPVAAMAGPSPQAPVRPAVHVAERSPLPSRQVTRAAPPEADRHPATSGDSPAPATSEPPLSTAASAVQAPLPAGPRDDSPANASPNASMTPSGLPIRRRPDTAAPRPASAGPAEEVPTGRTRPPDEVRGLMASYQRGTRAGRAAARQIPDEPSDDTSAEK